MTKVYNALAHNTSTQRCFICGESISHLNNIEELADRPIQEETLGYGFSILHAHIRFMDLVLHIAYRLIFKKWQVR